MSIDRIPLPRTDGALWLCSKRDIGPDPEAALAAAGGATTAVCLNHVEELVGSYPDYVTWLREHSPGRALWFPIRNFGAESADATLPLVDLIAERLEAGEGVLMHCAMGQGRAGTIAACVLMRLGAARDDALRTVAEHRVFAGPQDGRQWDLVDDVARAVGAD